MSGSFDKNRIFKNTLLLYVRMLFTMWLNLYTTRLVLANLGVEDMGVYGVVGSITSLFTVFVSGITSAIQRFITFELGRKEGNVNSVFCTSLNILFILTLILFVLLEVGGVWILKNNINIPEQSAETAFWVFQLSILTCLVNIISIPYNALIIAYEKMNAFAFISILQVILACGVAYVLSLFQQQERLLFYAIMMATVSILIRIVYQVYCHFKFDAVHYRREINTNLLKDISKYAGISTTSGILQVIANQGIVLMVNWTFGVAINAVYSIAIQLKNMILSFSLNLMRAISPQITKTYASGEMTVHKQLVYVGSKMEILLIYFIMIPFLFRTEYVMKLWLGNVPQHMVVFAQEIVFVCLVVSAMESIKEAVFASNRIVQYLIIPDSLFLLVLPISYIVGKITDNPELMMASIVIFDIVFCCLRIYIGIKITFLNLSKYLKQVVLPCFCVAMISCFFCSGLSHFFEENIWGFLGLFFCNSLLLLVLTYFCGLSKYEKRFMEQILYYGFIKIFNRK